MRHCAPRTHPKAKALGTVQLVQLLQGQLRMVHPGCGRSGTEETSWSYPSQEHSKAARAWPRVAQGADGNSKERLAMKHPFHGGGDSKTCQCVSPTDSSPLHYRSQARVRAFRHQKNRNQTKANGYANTAKPHWHLDQRQLLTARSPSPSSATSRS